MNILTRLLAPLAALAVMTGAAAAGEAEDAAAAVNAVYEAISGPPGEPRDFDALRALFAPGALMGVAGPGGNSEGRLTLFSVEDYIANSGPRLVEIGFVESETRRDVRVYGEIATVYSAYEGVRADTGELIAEGVNVFTLARTDGEWKILSLVWRQSDDAWPVERAFGP